MRTDVKRYDSMRNVVRIVESWNQTNH